MGTYNTNDTSTSNLLRGLKGLMSTVIVGVRISPLNLTLNPKP